MKKILRIMKITFFLCFLFVLQLHAENVYSQSANINLKTNQLSLQELMTHIEKQTGYLFIYNKKDIDTNRIIKLKTKSKSVADILNEVFSKSDISFKFANNYISLYKKEDVHENLQQLQKKIVTGRVTDAAGEPMIGVNVLVKGTTNGAITDFEGNYSGSGRKFNAYCFLYWVY